jgi:hypothetical protein
MTRIAHHIVCVPFVSEELSFNDLNQFSSIGARGLDIPRKTGKRRKRGGRTDIPLPQDGAHPMPDRTEWWPFWLDEEQ